MTESPWKHGRQPSRIILSPCPGQASVWSKKNRWYFIGLMVNQGSVIVDNADKRVAAGGDPTLRQINRKKTHKFTNLEPS